MAKKSNWIEGHIQIHESILNSIRDLITDKGETTLEVQKTINDALDVLEGWYEMREMFS
jgi:hypothetical protein